MGNEQSGVTLVWTTTRQAAWIFAQDNAGSGWGEPEVG